MTDTAAWHRDLSAGTLDVELDAGQELDIFALISVVNGVMRSKRFLEPTARRVRIILQELLTNVGRHVPDRRAMVRIALHESHLRRVAIDVGDNGPGIPDNILTDYTVRLLAGEREHGLLLVTRLATGLRFAADGMPWRRANHVGCDIVEAPPRPSGVVRNSRVGLVRVEYDSPKVLWIGPADSYTYYRSAHSIERFFEATYKGWLPVLALYFGPVLDTTHLVVEVNGHDVSTEVSPIFIERVLTAVETFFPDRVTEKRVVVLARMVDSGLGRNASRWAERHGLPWFDDETAAIAYLAHQTAGA